MDIYKLYIHTVFIYNECIYTYTIHVYEVYVNDVYKVNRNCIFTTLQNVHKVLNIFIKTKLLTLN